MAEPRMNVLVVVLDGARADHVSCYDYGRETTPFLDEVAREGVRFQHALTPAPCTVAAHASLFSGLFASTHGATDEHPYLSGRHSLLFESLGTAGYRTAAFCTTASVSPEIGFGRGVDCFDTQRQPNAALRRAQWYWRRASDRLLRPADSGARRTNQALLRWLAASDEPFCAFVHYNETHLPFHPPPPYDRMFLPAGAGRDRLRRLNQDGDKFNAGQVEMTPEDFTLLTALYDGALRYADSRVREVADALRQSGRWDQTLVVITADHGEHLGDHGLMSHAMGLYDTLLRIPLILRYPPRVPQGFVVEELAQTTDILPTILSLAGVADGGPSQGRSLIVDGRATAGPAFTVSERFRPNLAKLRERFSRFDTRPHDVRQKAIRTKREKFIWHSDEANELYDLIADPGETRNVIDRDSARADALRAQLFDWLAAIEKFEDDDGLAATAAAPLRTQMRGNDSSSDCA